MDATHHIPTRTDIRRMLISITMCSTLGFIGYQILHLVPLLFISPAVGWALPIVISAVKNIHS